MYNPVLSDNSIAQRGDPLTRDFACYWENGGADAAWVHLAGKLCVAAVSRLGRTLNEPQLQRRLVVLDLREVEQIDAAGVQAIANASIRARQEGRRLVLVRGPWHVDQAFTAKCGASPGPVRRWRSATSTQPDNQRPQEEEPIDGRQHNGCLPK